MENIANKQKLNEKRFLGRMNLKLVKKKNINL